MQAIILGQHPELNRIGPPDHGEGSGLVSAGRVLRVWERYPSQYGPGMGHEMHGDVQSGIPRL